MNGTDDFDYTDANNAFAAQIKDPKDRASYKRRIATMRKDGSAESAINVWVHTIWPVILFHKRLDAKLKAEKSTPPTAPRGSGI